MAKFSTFLCILLAAYGAQGLSSSTILDTAASAVKSVLNNTATQMETVMATSNVVTNTTAAVTELVNSAVTNANTQLMETVTSITAVVSSVVDVSPCLSLTTNFEEIVEGIGATAIAAVNNVQARLQARIESILAALQNLINVAIGFLKEINSCGSNIESFLTCIALRNLIPSVTNLVSSLWTTLLADIAVLSDESDFFTSSFSSTTLTAMMANIGIEMEESIANVNECVAALITV